MTELEKIEKELRELHKCSSITPSYKVTYDFLRRLIGVLLALVILLRERES